MISRSPWLEAAARPVGLSRLAIHRAQVVFLRAGSAACAASRDFERRTGLIGKALLEFPRTGKEDETHQKKDLVHEKARAFQGEILNALKGLCAEAGIIDASFAAQQLLLLINGYLVMEPLLGKAAALKLTVKTTAGLLLATPMTPVPAPVATLRTSKGRQILKISPYDDDDPRP